MSRYLAIDLGTSTTIVYRRQSGTLLAERSVLALDRGTGAVMATGEDAWRLIGRAPDNVVVVRPLCSGAISDYRATTKLLEFLLARTGAGRWSRPHTLVSVPSALTAVERRAIQEATLEAGARSCRLIPKPLAAGLGAGLPIYEPVGSLVVDLGGGTTEVALMSVGGLVNNTTIRIGGFDLDTSIKRYVRDEYALEVGERTAEAIKITVGSAWPLPEREKAEITGRDLASGFPKTIIVTSGEIREAISEQLRAIVLATIDCISGSPPELVQDVVTRGITLTGGGSLLGGLDVLLAQETEVPVHRAEQPFESVALGAGRALESAEGLESLLLDTEM
ncbi:MAG: rod shape-determining protein [Actinobacteria bacterium]|nr:rod shape-determining protein [Actinomycetota bacterium]